MTITKKHEGFPYFHGKSVPHWLNKLAKWEASDKRSRTLAIHAFCTQCMGGTSTENEEGYQEHIRGCTAPHCPLFNFRPYRKKDK